MNIAQVEEKVKTLVGNIDQAEFLFNLLDCYGKPKASITRLKIVGKGSYNLSKNADEVLWKKQVYFKATDSDKLLSVIDEMKHADMVAKHQPRFIIAINDTQLLAIDTKTADTLDVPLAELNKKFDFFLPWAGLEKAQAQSENPADVKAAEKMAKLFDLLRDNNAATTTQEIHAQNVFLSRILFCYFAEDTGIFEPPKLFTNHIASHTAVDGSDLDDYLSKIFDVMNQEHRKGLPDYITDFPYVNGGLFADKLPVPKFNRKSRAMLIECGADLNWSEINPDIFGSMIQAVVDPSQRGNMGMHYTSVPNIMKVIEPLFLNELKEEFEKHSDSKSKLEQLLLRLEHLKIFDPACGSGNFLIIAYKELRTLEMEIFKRLKELSKEGLIPLSRIKLSQFYGIELDDFAHEIAILSLWLKEHQMNLKFKALFGHSNPALPLKNSGNVACDNAAKADWLKVCPAESGYEVFIIGNPPYLGARLQDKDQKDDMESTFGDEVAYSNLDYIGLWFYKAAKYIHQSQSLASSAFVSTNSISQGEQTAILWPSIFEMGIEIGFVHQNFKWENNAKNNAAVICVIIGLRKIGSQRQKFIYSSGTIRTAKNIGPYLVDSGNDVIRKQSKPLADIPPICFGSMPNDGGNLLLTPEEAQDLIKRDSSIKSLIRKTVGSHDLLHGEDRYCLWLNSTNYKFNTEITERVQATQKLRAASSRASTKALAQTPYAFGEVRHRDGPSIVIPRHSSEKRKYIPIGFLANSEIINDSAFAIYHATPLLFGILSSYVHTLWVSTVGGRIKTDFRYSAAVCYNTFPLPKINQALKVSIEGAALAILAAREAYPELTLADMYDPGNEPPDLLDAHQDLDLAIESLYQSTPFKSDEDRLAALFKTYKKMTGSKNA
ncbi:type II restriction/modification system DNA methylase subunit YeeA [Janthinobacterium sp. 61]|uniref:DNA methyltransferase n=1 Tax=Janthinobacterium sp. 61 TaxID=2035209 RepID=UPI000CB1DF69|nr:DNA methyltransferase [Janthinobacterium sp. 61]PKV47880.1 type II restriction/modification system DNA methylase subunit YeeA [Janthinobacterium sp. 61]